MTMSDHGDYRATGSWDEVEAPGTEREADIPWGLGNDPPPLEAHQDEDDVYLCVACWQWHSDQVWPVEGLGAVDSSDVADPHAGTATRPTLARPGSKPKVCAGVRVETTKLLRPRRKAG
jgi:hypothetical protein